VLKSGATTYITQAITLNAAITLVKTQHPHVGELEVVKVDGVLASNQVIAVNQY
jgi:hypothetical protein